MQESIHIVRMGIEGSKLEAMVAEMPTNNGRDTASPRRDLGISKPDNVTIAVVALLKSRLRENAEIARILNLNTPTVGRGLEITASEPFEEYDVERIWSYMCEQNPALARSLRDWKGDPIITGGVQFLMDGGLSRGWIPTKEKSASLMEMPWVICHVAAAFLAAHEDNSEFEEATFRRWSERGERYGW